MIQRLVANWVYGGFLCAFLLLGLLPLFAKAWDPATTLVFLLLPIYMLHQFEEHDDDRFRLFVNNLLGGGREILSPAAVFVINIPGVWGVNLLALLLACFCGIGFGLIAVYLVLVNAIAHVGQALHYRRYNPGLTTAILLFLPFGCAALWAVQATGKAPWPFHALGLAAAIAIHAAIVGYTLRKSARS